MKKCLTSAVAVLFLLQFSAAQTIPNSGFENWSLLSPWNFEEPDGWGTSNLLSVISGLESNVIKIEDAHSGNFAIQLTTILNPIAGEPYPGLAMCVAPANVRPSVLKGFFKAKIEGNDRPAISVFFVNGESLLAGGGKEFDMGTDEFTYFEVPISEYIPGVPDSFELVILSSTDEQTPGTTFILDDLTFGVANGVEVPVIPVFKTLLTPNPAGNEMRVEVPANTGLVVLSLFDLNGKCLRQVNFQHQTTIDVSFFVPGQYFYKIQNVQGHLLDGGNFQIAR